MGSRLLIAAVLVTAILALGLVAKRVLIDSARVPDVSDFDIGIADVRRLARAGNGSLPLRVNSLVVSESSVPAGAVVAGTGFSPHRRVRPAFQIVYDDGFIVIDTANDRTLQDENTPDSPFFPERYERLQEALLAAKAIWITHEHWDHLGGVSRSPHLKELLPRLMLTREQLDNREQLARSRFPQELAASVEPVEYTRYHVAAPGVVLIKAPGHTPGSQMVYLLLGDGTEFLFVGDIAWHMDNVERLVGRPRLISWWFLGEDREAVLDQLRALYDLAGAEPIRLIVSHDADQLREYVATGRIGAGFE